MNMRRDEALLRLKAELLESMREYVADDDEPPYDEAAILRCEELLDEHLRAVAAAESRQHGLDLVRATVKSLNVLNEECGGSLIETDQRELICAFIMRAGAMRGFNRDDEDVTQEWREW
jgi:hypothetical protein